MQVTRRDLLRFALGGTLLRVPLGLKPGQLQAREPDSSGLAPAGESPFLQGNFGPVREESTVDELKIVGQLPREPARHVCPQRAEPSFRAAGQVPLVRRRRNVAWRPHSRREGQLPQPVHSDRRLQGRGSRRQSPLVRFGRHAGLHPCDQGAAAVQKRGQHGPSLARRQAAGPVGRG